MAELSNTRNKKQTPKVDLTAMVDLAFLLITFFMLTTSLQKQEAMDIAKPDEGNETAFTEFPASRTMTILLGKQNKVAWYMGEAEKSKPNVASYQEIRQSIVSNKLKIDQANGHDPKKSIYVIIKPTSGATYANFVDIMDELHIAKIASAPAIDDEHILEQEKNFMRQNKLL